ncbi:phosphoglycolate phosphatase [Sulfurisphaera javensis]|uniref:Phosphoglycolate phosphatase n=1 Tax=Sulfurisphaera javensis TaxID=2049879 RepID=A0AAT9GU35_9CREN
MIKLVLTDVDGTLTTDRDTYEIDLDAIEILRLLEKRGVKVGLVSGNSYPVLRGLYTYFNFHGGLVAENGCVVYYNNNMVKVCEEIDKNLALEFEREFKVRNSWQNEFKYCDLSFTPPLLPENMISWAKERNLYIKTSGYAIHISRSLSGKGIGVRKLIELHGLDKSEVLGIGDSNTDIEFLQEVGFKVVVGNGDKEVKKIADYITFNKSGKGVVEIITKLLRGEING